MTSLTFLGTGGGRFATIYQVRATGGIIIQDEGRLHLDPGPSALAGMKSLSLDPSHTDCVMVSHCHPDHYADAEMLIEGMTQGGYRRHGKLITARSVLEGGGRFTQAISRYHQSLPEKVIKVAPGDRFHASGMVVEATPTVHSDPDGVGFIFHTGAGPVSYIGDSEANECLYRSHLGSRVLIVNLTCPTSSKIPKHMHTEDAAMLISKIRPEVAVLTHFGIGVIVDGIEAQVRYIEEASGVRTIAAEDFMTIDIGKRITSRNAIDSDAKARDNRLP
ncbi:MAG TPA: MBL fold metallo-hydrolase [Methanomassiliicoccaceae archaeon]|jgi:phosphoribosyl 1,2-cyclic phosphodiesterase|nr:MBL fold metallo-hydrolase [Methanomassiliicoccaceae archaeon]